VSFQRFDMSVYLACLIAIGVSMVVRCAKQWVVECWWEVCAFCLLSVEIAGLAYVTNTSLIKLLYYQRHFGCL
jgi:hypothetical protein